MSVARAIKTILIAPALVLATGVLPAGEAEDLLRRSDAGVLAPPAFRARLAVEGQPAKGPHEIEVWRSGDSMLVRFLDAKERGKFVVQHEGEQWLIAPGARKPVRLKTSYRLYGGVTLEQIFSVPLERAYTIESARRESDAGGGLAVFELRARSPATLFPSARYIVREAAKRPVSALYRLRSGREAIAIEFFDWTERGPAYARRVTLRDLLRKGAASEVTVLELEEEKVPAALFDLENATARGALPP
ncbi:MAG TPA: outer membrane lipoprotein-sorting protein [Thermoanaerobaculia bacterium]|jgi:hypothetical protein|nr:outer membrane lipoprotein-sorting protein [Thermoanaerobaculia bacterium]